MKKQFLSVLALFMSLSYGTAFAASGVANIKGTKEGSILSGKAVLTDTPEGLKISLNLKNVPPGKHGFHIHENGACGDEGKAAGGHYNPDGVQHGLVFKDGFEHAHGLLLPLFEEPSDEALQHFLLNRLSSNQLAADSAFSACESEAHRPAIPATAH